MKLIAQASLAFKKGKPSVKTTFGANVINALAPPVPPTSKKNKKLRWEDLPVPVEVLQEVNNALIAAVSDSLTGKHAAVAALKNVVREWNNVFGLTAKYITGIADGDETVIREAGFVPTKSESQPSQKPGAVTGFNATVNHSKGAIIAGSKTSVYSARAYVFTTMPEGATINYNGNIMEITIEGKTIYINVSTRRLTEFYNLPKGAPYYVSMFAVNTAGCGPATPSQEVIPQ